MLSAAQTLQLPHAKKSVDMERSHLLEGVIDPNHPEEVGLLLHDGDLGEYI